MEAQLHHHRQACSAHRRRVEGARLILEIDMGELLAVGVVHDETVWRYLGRPRRRRPYMVPMVLRQTLAAI
jgi:hypothetical protein